MSRVFRRPMFRKGGGVNMNGIMSGIEDRQNYALAGSVEPKNDIGLPSVEELTQRNIETLQKAGGESTGYDPLTTFLLQYGPALASASPRGNFLSTALGAAKEPLGAMLQDKRRQEQYQRELRTQAAGAAIKTADEMRQAFEDRKFTKEMSESEQKFKTDLFKKETDRLLELQKADFSQEVKMLGLKNEFTGDMFEKERDLKLNMQAIDNALKSDLLSQEQRNKLEILNKQYENALGLLEAEMAGTTGISKRIEEGAQKLVDDEIVGSYAEAENQLTWKYKTSGDLMKQGYNVSDELLTEQLRLDPKKFSEKAKALGRKPGNEGRIFYFPKGDEYFVLEKIDGKGVFKPFDLPGKEGKTEKNSMDTSGDKGDNVVEEVDDITNYEYGTGDKRDQKTAIRHKIIDLKGPINNSNRLYNTSMTKDQKSAYERYLSDYRNQ